MAADNQDLMYGTKEEQTDLLASVSEQQPVSLDGSLTSRPCSLGAELSWSAAFTSCCTLPISQHADLSQSGGSH